MGAAIAAGHPLTAEAGARVLEAGGNAVDAVVAAAMVSWVVESPLTGPAGGGFLLHHDAREGRTRLYDAFVAVPGAGSRREPGPVREIAISFDGTTIQVFRTGASTAAVPGTLLGLEAAHRRHGSLPWSELAAPAIELARGGVELTETQGLLHEILDPLLRHSPEGRAVYGRSRGLAAGQRFVFADFAETLERIAKRGARELYAGETGRALARHVQAGGGMITRRDLAEYRVVRRRVVSAPYRGCVFRSNPPPSSGGVLIALGLRALERRDGRPGSAEALDAVAEAMRAQTDARAGRFLRDLYRGGLARRLLSGTTHISVIDSRGDAVSMSSSLGSGSGVVVPGTGVHVNNMLGEADLVGPARVGERLTSMMAPSVVLRDGRPALVVGSAGSSRLRGAILQIVANVIGGGMSVEDAVAAPRIHLEAGLLHCEAGLAARELDRLERRGWQLVRWRERNLFFGGVNAVEVRADGSLAAAGDPRRGGAGVVVE
jgi:gamma-glutamyltranspeptidase/glutathione hydrolase